MLQIIRIVLAGLILLSIAGPVLAQAPPEEVAFVDVNVVPMDEERILRGQTVLVRDGRITAVGPAAEVPLPDGVHRVDGAGRYLMPGLAEMHGHIPGADAPAEFVEDVLFLYVANGVTTVRGMQGSPNQLALRRQALAGEIVSPTLYLAGPAFSGGSIDSPEQAAERVRRQKEEGWDLLKVLPGLTRAEYDAMARTANEVGIAFAGHVPADVGLLHAVEMGQETIDHLDGYLEYLDGDAGPVSRERLEEVARLTRDAGVWVVPTMALWEVLYGTADLEALRAYPELAYMPPDQVASWTEAFVDRTNRPGFDLARAQTMIDNRLRLLAAMHRVGAPILMGTDAPQQFSVPGFSIHRELPVWVEAGMTPYEILRTGTENVGRYLRHRDTVGRVAEGHRADLVLLDENPLEDVAHLADPAGVMVRGRWQPRDVIRARLDEIAGRYR